jgi:hypothetical protein
MYRESGVDPGLCAPLDQDAIVTSGTLQLFDRFGRPRACLAEDVQGPAGLVPRHKGIDVQFIEWRKPGAWHMRAGILWRRTDIQQLMRISGVEKSRECGRGDGFLFDFICIHM